MAKASASRSPPRQCPSCWPSTGAWTGGPGRKQVAQPLLSHPYQPPAQCVVRPMRRGRNGAGEGVGGAGGADALLPPGARPPERRDRNGVRNGRGDKGETVRVLDAREGM